MIAVNWKFCLAILTCNVVFMSSSYTMLIPFLPMYLTRELGVDAASVNIWSGVVFSSTFLISAIIGPLFGGILAEAFGMRMSFFLAAGALFLNFVVLVFFIKEPPTDTAAADTAAAGAEGEKVSLWKIPVIRLMLVSAALVQVVILIVQPILTTYISHLAGELDNLVFISGLIFSLGGFSSAITAPLWGRFGQHHGFVKALRLSLVLAGIFFFVQAIPDTLYAFAASQFAIGLFFSGIYPSINAILAEKTSASIKGRVFGLMFSAQQVGAMGGPILGGVIATFLGMKYVFLAAGALLLFISIAVQRKARQLHEA